LRWVTLTDDAGAEWQFPAPQNDYLFGDDTPENSVVLEPRQSVDLQVTLYLESERPQMTKPAGQAGGKKPAAFHYQFRSFPSYRRKPPDTGLVQAFRTGEGRTKVEWKDEDRPERPVNRVLREPYRAKDP
jgi:hypothetical protein